MTALLAVRGLKKHFPIRRGMLVRRQVGAVQAVDGLDFEVAAGETLALVGESGCGKTTTGRLVLQLVPPTEGSVTFAGTELVG
ncbi:MAG: ATP-binding cassette domain-containing protein, partial [Alphaproteobacteria bacterium]